MRMLALLARNKDGDPRAASKSSSNGPTGLGVRPEPLKGDGGVGTLKRERKPLYMLYRVWEPIEFVDWGPSMQTRLTATSLEIGVDESADSLALARQRLYANSA